MTQPVPRWPLPPLGNNPGSLADATTPGSFANPPDIGGPRAFSSPDSPGMPPPSNKTAWDFLPPGWSTRLLDTPPASPSPHNLACRCHLFQQADGRYRQVLCPVDFQPSTQLEQARLGIVTDAMRRVAQREGHLTAEQVRDEVAAGRLVIPANHAHLAGRLDPVAIGRAAHTKINANLGASPLSSSTDEEVEKMRWAVRWGADTVMDLSTGGNLDATRQAIIDAAEVPVGTVPIYAMILGRKIEDLDESLVLQTLEHQAAQGVDYFTVHAGTLRQHLPLVRHRQIGIVSRGGSILAKWMLHHDRQNLLYEMWDDLCRLCRQHDVTFSIGDGLRPGGLADATDAAQLAELYTLGQLAQRAWAHGCQVMIEGPGHIPFDQIEYNMKLQRAVCHGAPFYVLGPLVTDIFPGYDHITSCIGATAAAYHGAAMLCYVTPKEHLGLPHRQDVKQGCIAYKIAAHAADIALGIPASRDRDDQLTAARAALNWEKHFDLAFDPDTARAFHDEDMDIDTDFCAMCGHDWCAVRISKEIQQFASGKNPQYQALKPSVSAALTDQQRRILEERGHLSPEQIHRLAHKTRAAMTGKDNPKAAARPACHSDLADDRTARHLQQQKGLSVSPDEPAET